MTRYLRERAPHWPTDYNGINEMWCERNSGPLFNDDDDDDDYKYLSDACACTRLSHVRWTSLNHQIHGNCMRFDSRGYRSARCLNKTIVVLTSKHDSYLMRHYKINETFANSAGTVECVSYIPMVVTNAKMSKIVYTSWVINKSKWAITHFENINFHFMPFCARSLSISLSRSL